MIKLFRNIRKKLVAEGKTANYLKYAVGEIVLVVIGILIALQINNWNQEKISKDFEQKMLIELKTSLIKDIHLFEMLIKRLDRKDMNINRLLDIKLNDNPVEENQVGRNISGVFLGIQISFDVGAYETIKALGLDKIKTDTLRGSIIRYFEVGINRTKDFLNQTEERYSPIRTSASEEFKNRGLTSYEFIKDTDTTYTLRRQTKFEEMVKSKLFEDLVINEMQRSKALRRRLEPLIQDASYVESLIDLELKTRFKK